MEYYIVTNDQRQGPFSVETLKQMNIAPDTMLWAKGMTQLVPAGQLPELRAFFSESAQGQSQEAQSPYQSRRSQYASEETVFQTEAPFQAYEANQGGGDALSNFFTDGYASTNDMPALKRWMNAFLGWIDDGRFFREPLRVIYIIAGFFLALFCLFLIFKTADSGLFSYAFMAALTVSVVLLAVGTFSVLFWINRSNRVAAAVRTGDDFVAIPLAAHIVQSTGEYLGIVIGTAVALLLFLLPIFAGDYVYGFGNILPFGVSDSAGAGFFAAVLSFLLGFVIVLLSHLMAEGMRALAAIANNTKQTAENTAPVEV